MMEREIVGRRRWVPLEKFLDLLGAASLIPGPSSSELAIYLGYERGGALGLLVAGVSFILPAALITGAIAWGYVSFGTLPAVAGALYGVKPVVIAIVVQAVWSLGHAAIKSWILALIAILAFGASLLGVAFLPVLVAAGLVSLAAQGLSGQEGPRGHGAVVLASGSALAATSTSFTLTKLFLLFLKVGAIVFGSGYVLLAFLRADLVDRLHWLSEAQLLDAVAVGQMTPGPVFTTATFIGYLLAGRTGATVATIGIFLPGFVFVAASRSLLARARRSAAVGTFLDGVNVSSLALMAAVTLHLGRAALVDPETVLLACASGVALVFFRVNPTWLIAVGLLAGIAARGSL
jgi:chromate transporter